MGVGTYKGCTANYHSIGDNIETIRNEYPIVNGYFGVQGDSSKKNTRHIESNDPIKTSSEFYDKLTHGSIEDDLSNGKGKVSKLKDGTIITYREISTSDGSPVVDINIKHSSNSSGVKQQKIHFVRKEDY